MYETIICRRQFYPFPSPNSLENSSSEYTWIEQRWQRLRRESNDIRNIRKFRGIRALMAHYGCDACSHVFTGRSFHGTVFAWWMHSDWRVCVCNILWLFECVNRSVSRRMLARGAPPSEVMTGASCCWSKLHVWKGSSSLVQDIRHLIWFLDYAAAAAAADQSWKKRASLPPPFRR